MTDREILPCPFCGAGKTEIREDRPWLGMRYGEPSSVSVRHWCEPVDGQPSRMIERVGRDRAAAIDAWNRRAAMQSQPTEAFPCRIIEADFETGTVTLEMQGKYTVSAGQKYLCNAPLQSQDREES